jgi:3-oxoacyl-[acyl-carrier-protein] synthase-3
MNSRITGMGSYLPPNLITNPDLEKIVDTSDEWITTRTGIKERRFCGDETQCSDMAVAASQRALEMARVKPEEIDLVLVGTVTPDYRLPSAACIVQKKMGLTNAAAMDIAAACAGFLHGLSMADAFIKAGQFKKIIVIGTEKLTSVTDYTDRNTCVLFGDGAGAALVEPCQNEKRGILSTFLKSDGRYDRLLWIPEGGSKVPIQSINNGDQHYYIEMNGNEVFKHAVRQMEDASRRVIKAAGLTVNDVSVMIPHQANIRIMQLTAKRLGIAEEKVFVNIEKYGNTSSASVPIALDEAIRSGRIKEGDVVLMTAFGGGLTWAAALIKW